jgi:polyhydroxyalkanoate synthesis regulator phasin
MHGAWNEAVQRFLREINDTQGTPITTWRELTDVWVKVANETLLATHRTPEFLEAQRRLTRSGAECRLQEREVAEAFCEMQQMPTRTEMDEVQREVYELRRRLRALEKSGMAAAAPEAPAPKATKKPAAARNKRRWLQHPRMLPMNSRMQFDPLQIAKQFADFNQRLQHGNELLRSVKDRDVQIATTPKTEVFGRTRRRSTTMNRWRSEPLQCPSWSSMAWSGATPWPICRRIVR